MAKKTVRLGRNRILAGLVILASIAITMAVADIAISVFMARHDSEFRGYAATQAVYSQSVVANADRALRGDKAAFKNLLNAREGFDDSLNKILSGNSATLMPGASGDVLDQAKLIRDDWNGVRKSISTILAKRDTILLARQIQLSVRAILPDLVDQWGDIAKEMAKARGIPDQQAYLAGRESYLGQRLQNEVDALVGGNGDPAVASQHIGNDLDNFENYGLGLLNGSTKFNVTKVRNGTIRNRIKQATGGFETVKNDLGTLGSIAPDMVAVHSAIRHIDATSGKLLDHIRALQETYDLQTQARLLQTSYGYIIGGVALIILLITLYIYLLSGDARKAEAYQQHQNERNQEAILRLLDELGSLADGDLTVEVSVTEDITGAIADSINFALEALRDLVRTINDTAVQVDAAARETRKTAADLADASEDQTRQITSAGAQITAMTESVEQVSENADRSTRVARQSVDIAHNGGEAVRRTIDGMNDIRETIQDTSKRIKRLGESSQEIGDIVELINDIAEQTNILALNAAIQASMAGEAGRGFAVVADEVQRLAERSANATRQIETLVKTIQTDTNEAVSSMEQSTAGVVNTAELAENAGQALDEIERVSDSISIMIQSISQSAGRQTEAASGVAETMNSIREITSRTSRGTDATATSIGKLAELATQLRTSVAGFKLPEPMATDDGLADSDEATLSEEDSRVEEMYLAEQQAS